MSRGVLALLLLLAGTPIAAAQALPEGTGSVVWPVGPDGAAMTVRYHRPTGLRADDPILFVFHGVGRNAEGYRNGWIGVADDRRLLVLVPEFSRAVFPSTEAYNLGWMVEPDGGPRALERWSFAVVERIFERARAATGLSTPTYLMFGHSAGAQFVHRYVTYWPTDRVARAVAANAGWYTLPSEAETFPYGLKGRPLDPAGLAAAFARPLLVLLGDRDTDRDDPDLRRNAAADRQGLVRFERGHTYHRVATEEAAQRGLPLAWTLAVVPGVGHDGRGMITGALPFLLPDRPKPE